MSDAEMLREKVKEYVDHADVKSLKIVQAILEMEQADDQDWWDELPREVQSMLNTAIKEGEEGNGITHEQMVEKYSQWFKK